MKELSVEYDPMFKSTTTIYADGEGGLVIREMQDVQDILELNKAQFAQTDERERWTPLRDSEQLGRHYARVPMIILSQWQQEAKRRDLSTRETEEFFKKKLDDRDNSMFRTFPGKLSR
jgi:hypothetical protein